MDSQLINEQDLRRVKDGPGVAGRVCVMYVDRASGELYRWAPGDGVMKPVSGSGAGLEVESSIEGGQFLNGTGGAPAVRVAAHEYDLAHFKDGVGALAADLSITDDTILLANYAPDISDVARNIEDFFKNWKSKSIRPTVIRLPPGVFKWDTLQLEQNENPFYFRSGLVLQGAGKGVTVLHAAVSDKPQFFGLSGLTNWSYTPTLRGLTLVGAGNDNPYQVGVFINPEPVPGLGPSGEAFGGLTSAHWTDVEIRRFAREQLWLRGGSANYQVPIQYGVWDRIMLQSFSAAYPSLRLDGQVGPPWDFGHVETGGIGDVPGAVPICYVGLDFRTGLPIVDVNADRVLYAEPHRFKTGDPVAFDRESVGTWGGLTIGQTYYAKVVDAFRLKLGLTYESVTDVAQTYVPLTSASGVGVTGRSAQVANTHIPPVQVNFKTFNCNTGRVALEVNGGSLVDIETIHCEDHSELVHVKNGGAVNVHSGILLQITRTSTDVIFKTFDEFSRINVGEGVALGGCEAGVIASSPNGTHGVTLPKGGMLGTYYPTIGPGLTGKLPKNFFQIGNDSSDAWVTIDLRQRIGGDYILNPGPKPYRFVRWQADSGAKAFFQVWVGSGYAEFDLLGNIAISGATTAGTMRLPEGASGELVCTGINWGARLINVQMPTHSTAWNMGTGTLAAGASITQTVACPGARVGDRLPHVGLSRALPAGLQLTAQITATDEATVTIRNENLPTGGTVSGSAITAFTGGGVALPGNSTVYVTQVR